MLGTAPSQSIELQCRKYIIPDHGGNRLQKWSSSTPHSKRACSPTFCYAPSRLPHVPYMLTRVFSMTISTTHKLCMLPQPFATGLSVEQAELMVVEVTLLGTKESKSLLFQSILCVRRNHGITFRSNNWSNILSALGFNLHPQFFAIFRSPKSPSGTPHCRTHDNILPSRCTHAAAFLRVAVSGWHMQKECWRLGRYHFLQHLFKRLEIPKENIPSEHFGKHQAIILDKSTFHKFLHCKALWLVSFQINLDGKMMGKPIIESAWTESTVCMSQAGYTRKHDMVLASA